MKEYYESEILKLRNKQTRKCGVLTELRKEVEEKDRIISED